MRYAILLIGVLFLAAPFAMSGTEPVDFKAAATKALAELDKADAALQRANAQLDASLQARQAEATQWQAEKATLKKQVDKEVRARKRAEEALHNRLAWGLIALGTALLAAGVCTIFFGFGKLAAAAIPMICSGVVIMGCGYAAMIYWQWVVAIGFVAILALVAAIGWQVRTILKKHNAGVDLSSTLRVAELTKTTDPAMLVALRDQLSDPEALKIYRSATS